ncbi:hypothetical protein [Geothrix sp. PMB-07]|uniref:hypothetical protein n=1 Tax=Geothrix sp. PMB-07 TaxID=3068640 RepID=UPI00274143C7|nr:hypothetical protein [Geothrix sp. PMB-07]WLT32592.1 hypothetical protein Q9293_04495 [Geothrix sp. PMB-07]
MFFHHSHHPSHRPGGLHVAGRIVAGFALAAVLAIVFGGVVMLLWNHILPSLLGTRVITFWQSVGLILLARILVGGFHHGHGHGRRHHPHRHGWREYEDWWKDIGEKSFQDYAKGGRPNDKPHPNA